MLLDGPVAVQFCLQPPLLVLQLLIGSHPSPSVDSAYPATEQPHIDELSPVYVHVWVQPPLLTAHPL